MFYQKAAVMDTLVTAYPSKRKLAAVGKILELPEIHNL